MAAKISNAVVLLKELKKFCFKTVKRSLFALLTLKLCLVLFRVSLLSNFKSHLNIDFLRLKSFYSESASHYEERYKKSRNFKVLAFSSYTLEKIKYLRFLLSNYISEKFKVWKKVVFFSIYIFRKVKKHFLMCLLFIFLKTFLYFFFCNLLKQ